MLNGCFSDGRLTLPHSNYVINAEHLVKDMKSPEKKNTV